MNRTLKAFATALAVVGALLFLAQPASAQMAKSGSFKGQFGWYGVGTVFEIGKDHIYWVGEFTGSFFNDAGSGPFHRTSVKCPAWNDVNAGKGTAGGYCILTDKDGDKAVLTWTCAGDYPNCAGPFEWTSGTGKYAGITGKSKFTGHNVTQTEGYAVWDATYKLP